MTMKHRTTQNQWDTAKAVLTEKFIPIGAFFKKQSQINSLAHHLKESEKEQTKSEVSRRKEVIKIREEINKAQILKQIRKYQ